MILANSVLQHGHYNGNCIFALDLNVIFILSEQESNNNNSKIILFYIWLQYKYCRLQKEKLCEKNVGHVPCSKYPKLPGTTGSFKITKSTRNSDCNINKSTVVHECNYR
jgi:hypothetical protein